MEAAAVAKKSEINVSQDNDLAQPILLTKEAFEVFQSVWNGVSDEHRAQLFVESLYGLKSAK